MASLKIPISRPPSLRQQTSQLIKPASALLPVHEQERSRKRCRVWRSTVGKKVGMRLKANLDVAAAVVGKVTEVNKDTFWPIVKAAGEKVVVLDMYTQWCGPCKVMAPKFNELSEKHLDIVFLKLDCNQDNKPLAQELGIKVVPTFKILKGRKVVKEVIGAKLNDLILAINSAKTI